MTLFLVIKQPPTPCWRQCSAVSKAWGCVVTDVALVESLQTHASCSGRSALLICIEHFNLPLFEGRFLGGCSHRGVVLWMKGLSRFLLHVVCSAVVEHPCLILSLEPSLCGGFSTSLLKQQHQPLLIHSSPPHLPLFCLPTAE